MRPVSCLIVCSIWITAAVGLLDTAPAQADPALNCDAYAASAVSQHRENQALGCGFAGGAWSADYSGHRNWCRRADVRMADLTKEDNARAGALAQCRLKADACDSYAALAREQNQMNVQNLCGLTGGRWSNDVAGHRAWSMSASIFGSTVETAARNGALAACEASRLDTEFQNMQEKQRQLLELLRRVMKALQESRTGTIRNMQ